MSIIRPKRYNRKLKMNINLGVLVIQVEFRLLALMSDKHGINSNLNSLKCVCLPNTTTSAWALNK